MANPLSRFNLTPTVNVEPVRYIDYVSSITPVGDFKKIENINVIMNSWNNILLTPRGTYDHDPEYGSGLYELLYQPVDVETMGAIRDEIYSSLYYYDNRATIESVDIKFAKAPGKGFIVNILVDYEGEKSELTIKIKDTA
jgi:phage baseplate assembly protein W